MNYSSTASEPIRTNQSAFAFVQGLASELSEGTIELPSFPPIALRIRTALDDANSSVEHIAHIAGAEPAFAARLMAMANSAAFTHTGKPLADLRSAIIRLGSNIVRSASIAFAITQMRNAPLLKPIAAQIKTLWTDSSHVAAVCYVLARHTRLKPDEAFLTGLLHAMGKLYVLVRSLAHPQLFHDSAEFEEIMHVWHANIGKAILENWNVPEQIAEAVAAQDERERKHYGEADLTDLLICAKVLAAHATDPAELARQMKAVEAFRQVRLDASQCVELLGAAAERMAALRTALGEC